MKDADRSARWDETAALPADHKRSLGAEPKKKKNSFKAFHLTECLFFHQLL